MKRRLAPEGVTANNKSTGQRHRPEAQSSPAALVVRAPLYFNRQILKGLSMRIYSGRCCMCDVGRQTGKLDMRGCELFTGDIVQLWHGNNIGTDMEEWLPSDGLTAIVANQYKSYSDGSIVLIDENAPPFTMGIGSFGISNDEWHVSLVKSHADIIAGERLKAFGFNYRN